MYLRKLKITHYRKFNEENNEVEFVGAQTISSDTKQFDISSNTTLIIGKNNAGKSTIINANIQVIPEKQNLVPIHFNETEIDESIITNWKGNAFLTYRTIFRDWTSTFIVEYLPDNISRDQVIELLQAMGFAGGIGAHRVGLKGGTNGKFHVEKVEMI